MIETLYSFFRAPNGLYKATEHFAQDDGRETLDSLLEDLKKTTSHQWEKLEMKKGTLYYASKKIPFIWILHKPQRLAGLSYILSVEGFGSTYAPEVDRFAQGLCQNHIENERTRVRLRKEGIHHFLKKL